MFCFENGRPFHEVLNDSDWKGSICEFGLGVELQKSMFDHAGASETILFAHSPYNKIFQGIWIDPTTERPYRSVSKQAASSIAYNDMHKIISNEKEVGSERLFSVVITGSHKTKYERGDSHGWICINKRENSRITSHFLHFYFEKDEARVNAAQRVAVIAQMFLSKVLEIGEISEDYFFDSLLQQGYIDVIDSELFTIKDNLNLLAKGNPLLFHGGKLKRISEYLRKYNFIYRGSFNPPTKSHEYNVTRDTIWEISAVNARKGFVDNLEERVGYFTALDKPLFLTSGEPLFVDLHNLLIRLNNKKYNYIVGVDTFNAIISDRFNPHEDFLEPFYNGEGEFFICTRAGESIELNHRAEKLYYNHYIKESPYSDYSSSRVRNGEIELVSDKIKGLLGKYQKDKKR